MSKDNLFDGISRILATPLSRRRAFRLVTGAATVGAVATLLDPQLAHADALECGDICGLPAKTCNSTMGTCPSGTTCIGSVLGKCLCCSQRCGLTNALCCCPGEVCKDGACVSACSTTTASITALIPGPPTQLEISVQNSTDGIAQIAVASAVNCTVSPTLPVNEGGTLSPVTVTATKTNQSMSAQIALAITDELGNVCVKDPIFTVLTLSTGRWTRQVFANIAPEDRYLTVTNGDPGLQRLAVWVNSKHLGTLSLREGETHSLNLSAALNEEENTITFVGFGELGGSASIIVVDTAPASDDQSGPSAPSPRPMSRHSIIWGPLAEETQENSDLHRADAGEETVRINFAGALSGAELDTSIFTVAVNGKPAAVRAVQVLEGSVRGGVDLVLQLAPGSLHRGENIDVFWEGLQDDKGRLLSGHVPLSVK